MSALGHNCAVSHCGVVWCGVPKALLPEGKGWDVYPRAQVNGRAVCVACALCVSVLCSTESGEKGDLEATHHGLPISPGAPADSLPFRLVVHALLLHTHAIVLFGPAGPSATWHVPWRGVPDPDGLLDDVAEELRPQCVGPRAFHVSLLYG